MRPVQPRERVLLVVLALVALVALVMQFPGQVRLPTLTETRTAIGQERRLLDQEQVLLAHKSSYEAALQSTRNTPKSPARTEQQALRAVEVLTQQVQMRSLAPTEAPKESVLRLTLEYSATPEDALYLLDQFQYTLGATVGQFTLRTEDAGTVMARATLDIPVGEASP